jgi:hypothetical protein
MSILHYVNYKPHFFSRPILDVTLTDEIDGTAFETKFGSLPAHWVSIPAGANVTHVVVVHPNVDGQYNFTSAQITYKTAVDADPLV